MAAAAREVVAFQNELAVCIFYAVRGVHLIFRA